MRGGSASPTSIRIIKAAKHSTGQKYYVLIVDCGSDDSVKTRIRDQHQNLSASGYSRVIGIRDVRPQIAYADIPRLEANLPRYISTSLIPVKFILAIMETEAWFLAESTHFSRIDPAITISAIKSNLGFDPENDSMELRPNPAVDLNDCYHIGGKSYKKKQTRIDLTINGLHRVKRDKPRISRIHTNYL